MKAYTVALILPATAIVGGWLVLSFPAKLKYEQARRENSIAYQVTPMDQQFVTFLSEVQSQWACAADVTNGPNSDVVKLAGMIPSVRNLIYVYNYQMPKYRWFGPSQNRKSAAINLIKAKFMPRSIDHRWYLSADEHLAALHCRTNMVYVYRDEASGLRETLYYVRKKNEGGDSNTLPSEGEKRP